ncbi:hypothetical protein GGR50DRAFT_658232, partial [Xylaria sp. CBS 124048]
MDEFDPNVSNGSCWANVNVALPDEYIPCGNAADGNSHACCHVGDNCLSSNACYHDHFGITYLAGCTNQDFSGPACQDKGVFFNQPWVGLTRCDPDQSLWAGCPEKGDVVGTDPPTANCKCSKGTTLFRDAPTLENIASLPLGLGDTISWFPGHEPTATTLQSSPSSTSKSTLTSVTIPSITPTASGNESSPVDTQVSTPSKPPAKGLSMDEKVGIAVGIGAGVLAIGCIIFMIIKKRKAKNTNDGITGTSGSDQPFSSPVQPDPPVPGFSILPGFKAELPAEPPISRDDTEASLTGSTTMLSIGSSSSRQYIPYRPGSCLAGNRTSLVSQLSSPTQGLPDTPVSAPSSQPSDEPSFDGPGPPRTDRIDTIHEL